MTKVMVNPGICGFVTSIEAQADEDKEEVKVIVKSGCKSIRDMMAELGDTFDPYEICLQKPGAGPFFSYAQQHFPVHAGCAVFSGLIKCIEAECGLALKKDASIQFIE